MLEKKINYNFIDYLIKNDCLNKYNNFYILPKIKNIKLKINTNKFKNSFLKPIAIKDIYSVLVFYIYFINSIFPVIKSFDTNILKQNLEKNYIIYNEIKKKESIFFFLDYFFFEIFKKNCTIFLKDLFIFKTSIFLFKEIESLNNNENFNLIFKDFDIEISFFMHNFISFKNTYKLIPHFWKL